MVVDVLGWLAQNALLAGILAGFVALACRLGRFGPAVRHALWLLVLLKLVTPPLVEWPWKVPLLRPGPRAESPSLPQPAPLAAEDGVLSLLAAPEAVEPMG